MQYANAEIPVIFNGNCWQIFMKKILIPPHLISGVNFAHTTFHCRFRSQLKMFAPIDQVTNNV